MYYMAMATTKDDVDAQRRGVVEIFFLVGNTRKMNLGLARKARSLQGALPCRTAATHVCSDQEGTRIFYEVARHLVDQHRLSRSRVHLGTLKNLELFAYLSNITIL